MIGAALGVGLFGCMFERLFMSRVYGADVLMQLLVCYGFILILDDAVKIIWGAEFRSMGMPAAFQRAADHARGRRAAGVLPVPDRRRRWRSALLLGYVITETAHRQDRARGRGQSDR